MKINIGKEEIKMAEVEATDIANLPFTPQFVEAHDTDLRKCGLYRILPPEAQDYMAMEKNRHVLDYQHMIPTDEIGIPAFYTKLDRKLGDIKHPNLIYPVGDQICIHIYPDKTDIRDYYIPIEPPLFKNFDALLMKIEEKLADLGEIAEEADISIEEKRNILEAGLSKICVIEENAGIGLNGGNGREGIKDLFGSLFTNNNGKNKILVTSDQFQALKYLLIRDKIGLGVLEPLIRDPYIEDISCSGLGQIFVEHKIFSGLKTTIEFNDKEKLDTFLLKLSEKVGKPVSYRNPIIDAALPDGSRLNMVFGEDVSKRGSNFTIRKFSETPSSILDLIDFGTLDYRIAAYLWMLIEEGMNCFVAGETASGKTTTLNAITTFLPPDAKVVSIEDTPELQIPLKNWTREVTRGSGKHATASDVTMFDLLKASLRQRPNEIIIGEIRGVEGNIAFQGMQTGHAVLSTFHAASVEKLLQRLTGDPINVPKSYIDSLNLVVIQNAVKFGDRLVRRITSINEILGYDPVNNTFSFVETFVWNPANDSFAFTANMNDYLLEYKIAPKKRIPHHKRRIIYTELEKRANTLKKIHQAGITNFYDLFSTLIKVKGEGVLK